MAASGSWHLTTLKSIKEAFPFVSDTEAMILHHRNIDNKYNMWLIVLSLQNICRPSKLVTSYPTLDHLEILIGIAATVVSVCLVYAV